MGVVAKRVAPCVYVLATSFELAVMQSDIIAHQATLAGACIVSHFQALGRRSFHQNFINIPSIDASLMLSCLFPMHPSPIIHISPTPQPPSPNLPPHNPPGDLSPAAPSPPQPSPHTPSPAPASPPPSQPCRSSQLRRRSAALLRLASR